MITDLTLHVSTDGKRYFSYPLFESYKKEMACFVLSRDFDITNRTQLMEVCETKVAPVMFDEQLHGITVVSFKKKLGGTMQQELRGDIFMTDMPNLPLMIRTADCAAVVIYDPVRHVIANAHAGWRGIAQKAVTRTVTEMCERYGSRRTDLFAAISPMIGPCCAQFSDPDTELPHFMKPFFLEENHVDLWAAVENQLYGSGVLRKNISNPRVCTVCHPEYFHSFRRDKENAGRFGTIALLK